MRPSRVRAAAKAGARPAAPGAHQPHAGGRHLPGAVAGHDPRVVLRLAGAVLLMRKSSVLITGAGGEIGHGLIDRLAADQYWIRERLENVPDPALGRSRRFGDERAAGIGAQQLDRRSRSRRRDDGDDLI